MSLVELALPALRTLAELSGETINLGVPTPLGVEHLAQEDSRHFVGGTNWVGRRVPYDSTANGKVLKAFTARAHRRRQRDPRARLRARRRRARTAGLPRSPLPSSAPTAIAVAALSISGPTIRLTRERMLELAPHLIEQARSGL